MLSDKELLRCMKDCLSYGNTYGGDTSTCKQYGEQMLRMAGFGTVLLADVTHYFSLDALKFLIERTEECQKL